MTEPRAALETGQGGAAAEALAALHARLGGARAWLAAEYAQLMADPAVAVHGLRQDGRLIGFVVVRVAADEGEILMIGVDPPLRGRGHGQRLATAALAWASARGAARVFLEVAEDNETAQALYRRLGFRPAGRRRGYYRSGACASDAVILCRDGTAGAAGPAGAGGHAGGPSGGASDRRADAASDAAVPGPFQALRTTSRCAPSPSPSGASGSSETTS